MLPGLAECSEAVIGRPSGSDPAAARSSISVASCPRHDSSSRGDIRDWANLSAFGQQTMSRVDNWETGEGEPLRGVVSGERDFELWGSKRGFCLWGEHPRSRVNLPVRIGDCGYAVNANFATGRSEVQEDPRTSERSPRDRV